MAIQSRASPLVGRSIQENGANDKTLPEEDDRESKTDI